MSSHIDFALYKYFCKYFQYNEKLKKVVIRLYDLELLKNEKEKIDLCKKLDELFTIDRVYYSVDDNIIVPEVPWGDFSVVEKEYILRFILGRKIYEYYNLQKAREFRHAI